MSASAWKGGSKWRGRAHKALEQHMTRMYIKSWAYIFSSLNFNHNFNEKCAPKILFLNEKKNQKDSNDF